ncbi:MAG: sigma-54 dependent transcriptional regulator [bacterium]
MSARILIVDDEASMREFLSIALGRMGYDTTTAQSGEEALERFGEGTWDIVLTDIRMPDGMDGVSLLEAIKETSPDTQVILMTAYASLDTAVKAVQLGALDYVTKPFKIEQIKSRLDRALEQRKLRSENLYLRKTVREKAGPERILGESSAIQEVRDLIMKVAPSPSTVLITGESGTGKELVARALHELSSRSDGAFVSVNCAALPENLLESELFGHKKGSFTGAVKDKEGLFQVADGGTLFLDEVSEMSPPIQVKLLRALQEREVVPVGGTRPTSVDVRMIAATNASLEEMVAEGRFREDLYYRLNVVPIPIPPLRDRKEDISLLARHFLDRYTRQERRFSEGALRLMQGYEWPGNVRELENAVERAVIISDKEVIGAEDLPARLTRPPEERLGALKRETVTPTLETIEKAYIKWVLDQSGGVKTRAAETLGIDPSTLHRKMDRYGLREGTDEDEEV